MTSGHIAIVGPTASGKSWLALEVAHRDDSFELVSVDSMQVYRGMDIGTAKPSPDEQQEVVHHCIDLVDPDEDFALAEFQPAARAAIADIEARGKRVLLVGGTGLYLQAVVDGLELPGQFPEVRSQLEEQETAALYARLTSLDPDAARRMEPGNRRRVLRALEVTVGASRPFSSFGPGMTAFPATDFRLIGVWLPREVAIGKIEARVDDMIAAGLVDEVKNLRENWKLSKTAKQALGYKEILDHLDGLDLETAVGEVKRRTRSFARRQRAWFRRDPRIKWLGSASGDPGAILGATLRECESS